MELLLVRHGLPQRVEGTAGPADPPLSRAGSCQAALLADYLASERIDALYTSPLRRASQTAEPVGARTGLTPVVLDDVAEYDRDATEYVPLEDLRAAGDPRFLDVLAGRGDGLDRFDEFEVRVRRSLDAVIAEHPGDRVVVVCHGGVINLFLATVLGLPTAPPGSFAPNYTSIHRVAASRSGLRTVITVNETPHLRGTGLPMGLFQNG